MTFCGWCVVLLWRLPRLLLLDDDFALDLELNLVLRQGCGGFSFWISCHSQVALSGQWAVVGGLGDLPTVADKPLHHLELAHLRRDVERGGPVVVRLGDLDHGPRAPAPWPNLIPKKKEKKRGFSAVGRLGGRAAVAGKPLHHARPTAGFVSRPRMM